jgi:hypothetical protein
VPFNDWCSHQMWEVVWWVSYMARWAYIYVGTIHVLCKLFHFSLLCGQQLAQMKFPLNLCQSVLISRKWFLCSSREKARQVWSINLSVFISWFFLLSLCHNTSSTSVASKVFLCPPLLDQMIRYLCGCIHLYGYMVKYGLLRFKNVNILAVT